MRLPFFRPLRRPQILPAALKSLRPLVVLGCAAGAALGTAGCVNRFAAAYVAQPGGPPPAAFPAASRDPARIIPTANLRADLARLEAQGYVVLGRSAFEDLGALFAYDGGLSAQARAVGADVVLFKKGDLGPAQETPLPDDGFDSVGHAHYAGDTYSYEKYKYVALYLRRPEPPRSH